MSLAAYVAQDRRAALMRGAALPVATIGAALFADIAGFTPLTEALTRTLGARRGAEELPQQINRVYAALINEVEDFGGSVIGFAGDAMTCWFAADDALDAAGASFGRASACALALQAAMADFATVPLADGSACALTLKVSVAGGPARRFAVGDPAIQRLDVLAGTTIVRMSVGEHLAQPGEVLIDTATVAALGDSAQIVAWRTDAVSGDRFGVLGRMNATPAWQKPAAQAVALADEQARPWLLPAIYERQQAGFGAFLIELRPAVVLFCRFTGIDYEHDSDAEAKLDAFIRRAQAIVTRYDGTLLRLTIGDKGSYVHAVFGAPYAHEDDARRALSAALDLHALPDALPFLQSLQIGISQGIMRTGTCGSAQRQSYDVYGDDVNVAARLMQHAAPGQTLVSDSVERAVATEFTWQALPPLTLKGKAAPLALRALQGRNEARTIRLQEPRYTLPMVGRAAELALIAEKIAQARRGHGQVVGITAEAGMGKSRLVAEVIRLAHAQGFTTYGGECQSYGTNTAYLVWQPIWRAFFGLAAQATLAEQTLERDVARRAPDRLESLPLLDLALDLPLPPNGFTRALEPQFQKSAREALLLECLQAAAREAQAHGSGMLFVLEDLHWIDALSHDLLELIARAIVDLPVLIVAAYRPPEIMRLQAPRVEALPHFTSIPLNALSEDEAEHLIALKLQQIDPHVDPSSIHYLRSKISERAQGNPFYIEELLHYVQERGIDPHDSRAIAALDLPNSLHSLVLSRIDQLSQQQQITLKVASIIGRVFRVAWLHAYYPGLGAIERLKADLDDLARLELTPLDAPEPELAYLFKHIVTQEVAYESLAYATRAALHEQFAAYLETVAGADAARFVDLLAFHYDRSANLPKRRAYLRQAGEAAVARYANDAAIEYLSRALDLAPQDDLTERFDLLLAREQVNNVQGARDAQRADLDAIEALADRLNDTARRVEAATRRAYYAEAIGDYGAVTMIAQQAVALATAGDLAAGEAQGRTVWAYGLSRQGNYAEARAHLDRSVQLARSLGDENQEARALGLLSTIAGEQGDYRAAQSLLLTRLELTRRINHASLEASTLDVLGCLFDDQGDYAMARNYFEQSVALARRIGVRRGEAITLGNLGLCASRQGDYVSAGAYCEQALQAARLLGERALACYTLINLGYIAVNRGDDTAASTYCLQALQDIRAMHLRPAEGYALWGLGNAWLGLGRVDEAATAFREALAHQQSLGHDAPAIEAVAGLARVALAHHDVGQALIMAEEIARYLDDHSLDGMEEPLWVYLTCYQALHAAHDPRAHAILTTAYTLLHERAAKISDEATRQMFVENVPYHRAIVAAWAARQAAEPGADARSPGA